MLKSHGRYGENPITQRRDYTWPDGKRLAVYVALGVEAYAFGEGMTENLVPGEALSHDVLNASWRDYGNRVGAWRLLELMRELNLPLTILLNTALYEECPALCAAFRAQGCEIVAHGHSNSDTMAGMTEPEEAAYIARVTADITKHETRAPKGWASPWIAETPTTPETLQAAGYTYLLNWCMDDQPTWLTTRNGRMLSVPYSQEINDSSTIIGRLASAADFADMIVDQFDQLLADSVHQPVVMNVILHSFISGQPFRRRQIAKALAHIARHRDVIFATTPGGIAEFVLEKQEVLFFFFLTKKLLFLCCPGARMARETTVAFPQRKKEVFWFFFSKKNRFLRIKFRSKASVAIPLSIEGPRKIFWLLNRREKPQNAPPPASFA